VSGQPAAQLGVLQQASDTETAYGGRTQTWATLAALWVHLAPGSASYDQADGEAPSRVETANAAARDHPDAAAGQRLQLGGAPWSVLAVQRPQPGRMVLVLQRQI
jgi:head-tail adaptor